MKTSVIYRIRCSVNNRSYIGQSDNFLARKHGHLSSLYRGNHISPELQRDFDLYGEDAFAFSILREAESATVQAEEYREIKAALARGDDLYNWGNRKREKPLRQIVTPPQGDSVDAEDFIVRHGPHMSIARAAKVLKVSDYMIKKMMAREAFPLPFAPTQDGPPVIPSLQFVDWLNSLPSGDSPQ